MVILFEHEMVMAKTTLITDLPHEILDQIFGYLAWTPSDSLVPSDPDITNISLSCRALRKGVLPTLFRNVCLKLRWVEGAIAEPGIYRLRREAPHIAKHVRCVHINTQFTGDPSDGQLKPFTIPLALDHWTATASDDAMLSDVERRHRARVQEIAEELYGHSSLESHVTELARKFFGLSNLVQDPQGEQSAGSASKGVIAPPLDGDVLQLSGLDSIDNPLPASSASESGLVRRNARGERLKLDALIACMLSIPPQTNSIIFEAVPKHGTDQPQHAFALQVCAMAMKIFADRLSHFGIISRALHVRRVHGSGNDPGVHTEDDLDTILTPNIEDMRSVTNLTLAATTEAADRLSLHSLDAIRASTWQVEPLCSNVTQLCLRTVTDKRGRLFDLITGFTALKELIISGVTMGPDFGNTFHHRRNPQAAIEPVWLLFLISLRLHCPDLQIRLSNLQQWAEPKTLPASATKWLEQEAVPVGANVDFERETRLTEDFSTFMTMWEADDGERGLLARDDSAVGKLVDDAFTSRWRTFANMR